MSSLEGGAPEVWPSPSRHSPPAAGEVHVWLGSRRGGERLTGFLSASERDRAADFRRPADRERFAAARGALRGLLGLYLDVRPHEVGLSFGPEGKPIVSAPGGGGDLEVSITHSGDFVMLAVAYGRQVGVDLERVRTRLDAKAVAGRFLPTFVAEMSTLDSRCAVPAFFDHWVAVEAVLKARGEGLKGLEGRPALEELLCGYSVRPLPAPRGYAAAVAAEGEGWTLERWRMLPWKT